MKTFFSLTSLAASAAFLTAHENPASPQGVLESSGLEAIQDARAMRVHRIESENKDAELPSPDYWGIKGAVFGASRQETTAKSSKPAAVFLGKPCTEEPVFNAEDRLVAKRFHIQAPKGKAERLADYQTLIDTVKKRFGDPTESPSPVQSIRGEDAFISGKREFYQSQWKGPEMELTIHLSGHELYLEFRQSSHSKAQELESTARQTRDLIEKLKSAKAPKITDP